jgi:hypothetical protein
VGGLALIIVLLVHEYTSKRPLLCLRALKSTFPVAGITVAICAAAASVSAITLVSAVLQGRLSPVHLGLLNLPEFGGALVTAIGLGLVFSSRLLHYYPGWESPPLLAGIRQPATEPVLVEAMAGSSTDNLRGEQTR